jgi:glycosyltransferase involved in cell wall biosynthesis
VSADISVVISAYDIGRWRHLQGAVQSLEQQTLQPQEVVIVIDHNDELLRLARSGLPGAIVIENAEARGVRGVRNTGVAACSSSIVAFLDDDAFATRDWIALLLGNYERPEIAGVGGAVEPVWADSRPRWFPPEFDWVVGCTYLGMPQSVQEVRNLIGCNMSFRRELIDALGGFRIGYSHDLNDGGGCDETELCIRLRQRWPEKKLLYLPEAKVFHHVPASRAKLRRFLARCYFEGGSKAVLTRLVGIDHGLSTERRYTRVVLPAGVSRGVGDFLRRGDVSGLTRGGTIIAGLGSTAAGYAAASFSTRKSARRRGWEGQF